jgi:hypothetical protein
MSRVYIEKYYPLVISVTLSIFTYIIGFDIKHYPELAASSLTITAIFIGFMGTLAGILLSANSKAIRFMKKVNKLSSVLGFILHAIHASFVFLALSLTLQITTTKMPYFFSYLWVFFGFFALFLTYSVFGIIEIHKTAVKNT